MNINEIVNGDRVLVQSGAETKEVATAKTLLDNGLVLVRLSDGKLAEMHPRYILKSFGS